MIRSRYLSFRAKRGISRLRSYFVYIMASKTGTLYIGVTNDLRRRVLEHKMKLIKGFTEKYNVERLVYYDEFSDINQAIEAEKKLKGWTRQKKIDLIKTINPVAKDLAEDLNLEILHSVQDDKKDKN